MSVLFATQYMTAAAFFTVALMHMLVWLRRHAGITDLSAAIMSLAAGANAIAEHSMYCATDLRLMAEAMKLYVATSGVWIVSLIWFVAAYTRVSGLGRSLAATISAGFIVALVLNFFSKSSFVYTELTGLREINLPWGERISLAEGKTNPWRYATDLATLGIFGLVLSGGHALLRQGRKTKAWTFTVGMMTFLLFWGTHASLVDTGTLDSPYLSTYAFLIVVFVMSYDLSGDIVRTAELSGQLKQKELELRTAITGERNRIAGDLHDSVTQTLFATAAIAEALPDIWEQHPEEARRGLTELRQMTRGALAEMRSLLLELRPAALLEKSLSDLLAELAAAREVFFCISLDIEACREQTLPDDVKVMFYRVAQEALNNAERHADASHVHLKCQQDGHSFILSIRDDGRGFSANVREPESLGLEIMTDRVVAAGGVLQVESEVGQGTCVTVSWNDSSNGAANE